MRLTKAIKQQIINKIKEETITPRVEAWRERLAGACQDAADRLHDKKTLEWLQNAPPGGKSMLVTMGKVMPVMSDGQRISDPFRPGLSNWVSLERPVYNPGDMQHSYDLKVRNGIVLQEEINGIADEWAEVVPTIRAALNACNTVKQLNENYPDLFGYMPMKAEEPKKTLIVTNDKVKTVIDGLK